MIKITYNGKEYKSLKKCCEDLGINYYGVCKYMKHIDSDNTEYIITQYINTHNSIIEYNGKKYKNLTQCCKSLGISQSSVYVRIKKNGGDSNEAIDYYLNLKNNPKKFIYNGEEHTSFTQCCKSIGVSQPNVSIYAKNNNVSIEDAITHFLHSTKKKKFIYNDTEYNDLKKCCNELGVRYCNIIRYKRMHNVGANEAIDYYLNLKNNPKKFIYKDKEYDTIKQCCKSLKINYASVSSYSYKHAVSVSDSIDHFIINKKNRKKI